MAGLSIWHRKQLPGGTLLALLALQGRVGGARTGAVELPGCRSVVSA